MSLSNLTTVNLHTNLHYVGTRNYVRAYHDHEMWYSLERTGILMVTIVPLWIATQLGLGSSRDRSESPLFYEQLLSSRELLTRLLLSRFPDPGVRPGAADDSVTLLSTLRIRDDDPQRALETAVKRLRRRMRVTVDLKTNLVGLTLDARSSRLAADAANRAVALVSAFNKEQRASRARARRDFLETRVAAAQAELRAVEDSQKAFYERNRSWQNSPSLIVEDRRLRRQVETASTLYRAHRRGEQHPGDHGGGPGGAAAAPRVAPAGADARHRRGVGDWPRRPQRRLR